MRLDEWYEVMARGDGEAKRNGGGVDGPGPKRGAEGRRKDVAKGKSREDGGGKKKAEASQAPVPSPRKKGPGEGKAGAKKKAGKKAIAELWSDLATTTKSSGKQSPWNKTRGTATNQAAQRAVDLGTRLTGRGTRPGSNRVSGGSERDALPFLQNAEKAIRDKIDHEGGQTQVAFERRKIKIKQMFALMREKLREREEELISEIEEAKGQSAVHLFSGKKAALTLIDPTVHAEIIGMPHMDKQGLLADLASGLNTLKLSFSGNESLDQCTEDVVFYEEEELMTRIKHFGVIGSSWEDEQVFGTLSAISKLLHPIEVRLRACDCDCL